MLLMVLYFWSPSKQTLYVFFIVAAAWGLAEGMLITQIVSKSINQSIKHICYGASYR